MSGLFAERRQRAAQESRIRQTTSAAAQANWIGCLPALARLKLHAPLEDIYEPLRFRYEARDGGLFEANLNTILQHAPSFAIVGPPGSGKSTIASILANAYAKDTMEDEFQLKDSRLPLLVSLSQMPADLALLPEVLCDLLQAGNCPVHASFLTRQLTQAVASSSWMAWTKPAIRGAEHASCSG